LVIRLFAHSGEPPLKEFCRHRYDLEASMAEVAIPRRWEEIT
jgi:hypothetical protein